MSRGGRRRGRSVPRARKSPRPASVTKGPKVFEEMAPRRSRLATLEPDGTVLEELIEDLQTEYGTPTTPQEYRLHIKVATAEEAKELASTQTKTEAKKSTSSAPGRRRNRGRRRSRRRPKTDSPPNGGAAE